MIRSIENTYKYRPHIPIGGLGTIAVVSGIVLAIFASRYGLNHSPFMLTMTSLGSLSFVATCIVGAARFRMVHNIEEELDHYFGAPNGIAYLENFLPRPVLGIIRGYLTSVERVCEEPNFRETLIELCKGHNDGLQGVLKYQKLSLPRAFSIMNDLARKLNIDLDLFDETFELLDVPENLQRADQFRLATILLLTHHENDEEIPISNHNMYYDHHKSLMQLDDQDLLPLWIRHLSYWELTYPLYLFAHGSENTAILFFEATVKKIEISNGFRKEHYTKACLFGWSKYLEKLLKNETERSTRPNCAQNFTLDIQQDCWFEAFRGALTQKTKDRSKIGHGITERSYEHMLKGDYLGVVRLLKAHTAEIYPSKEYARNNGLVEIDELLNGPASIPNS